ncbi:hypothetical protein QUB68_05050 [Microcoleus sp. A006_D1]|uniref:hypothetical protein n=1 Tax=Microcoleus sp. A006_D1 TaxID=3055267 RepID=UPI002FD5A5BA
MLKSLPRAVGVASAFCAKDTRSDRLENMRSPPRVRSLLESVSKSQAAEIISNPPQNSRSRLTGSNTRYRT